MKVRDEQRQDLERRVAEAEATIEALLSGQIDAVVDAESNTPVLLAKAQDALRASEARYRSIVETAHEGMWEIEATAKTTFVNTRMAEMLGYTVHEMIGMPMADRVTAADWERLSVGLRKIPDGHREDTHTTFLKKDGSEIWASVSASRVLDAEGRYLGSLAMITDRTAHRASEEALRASEEQYRQIVETTTDGIIKIGVDAKISFVNRRFAEMLGYEPAQMIGISVLDFLSAAARRIVAGLLGELQPGGKSNIDTTFLHKDGTEIAVNVAGSTLIDETGHYVGSLGIVRDMTERKKLQSQLMVSDRMASVGTLAAGVAHEINNPLAAVIANLDFMSESLARRLASSPSSPLRSDGWLVDELRSPIDDAREAAQRVRFIVRDLKVFSRAQTEEANAPVEVKAVLESSLRMAWNEIRHRAHVVKRYGVIPVVLANEARLGQVFLNLIVNAAQAIPDGRAEENEICVTTRLEGNWVFIEVSDTGPGIPPEILDRIFDAFFTTKAVGVGTGLGLAICQRIVTDMGGALTVSSRLGAGSTFRVALPAALAEASLSPDMPTPDVVVGRRGRILIVDDEELVLRSVKRTLGRNHDVQTAVGGAPALALCRAGETFDLILCDLMMPEMTGMELHKELAMLAPEMAKRMIFLTGGAFTDTARLFLADPPKEHIEKPFDPGNLRAVIQRYLLWGDDAERREQG